MNTPELEVISRNILIATFILGMVIGGVISTIVTSFKKRGDNER